MEEKAKLVTKADVLAEIEFIRKSVEFCLKNEKAVIVERDHLSKEAQTTNTDLHRGRLEAYGKVKTFLDSAITRAKEVKHEG